MITLAINTASSGTAIALFKDKKLMAETSWKSQNNEAEKLMPEIAQLLENKKTSLQNIEEIFVIRGPGSFTGLRIGVTVANTLAYLNQAKLYCIDTFEYHQAAAKDPVLLFAGSMGVYLCEKIGAEPELINLPDLHKALSQKSITQVQGDISPEQKSALKNIKFIETSKTFGQIMEKVIAQNHPQQTLVKPLYIKPPGISLPKN